jgi:hypothetical protein
MQTAFNIVGQASRLPGRALCPPALSLRSRADRRDACPTRANTFGARTLAGAAGHARRFNNKQKKVSNV